MTDLETVARAEDRSRALEEMRDLIDEYGAPICTDGVWRFPASEGEEQQ
ncbi:hypothetical protein ACQP1P_38830 [Dactylosporangium sp. CA-052675]